MSDVSEHVVLIEDDVLPERNNFSWLRGTIFSASGMTASPLLANSAIEKEGTPRDNPGGAVMARRLIGLRSC